MYTKKGYTLAEVLITLGIIGIITMSAMIVIKPYNKATKEIY